jgi:hypothetical protein
MFIAGYGGTFVPTAVHTGLLGSIGSSVINTDGQVMSFSVPAGSNFDVVVSEVQTGGCAAYSYTVSYSNSCQQPGFDPANDGSADLAVWRPNALAQYLTAPVGGATTTTQYGSTGMIPTPADWDGDGDHDVGMYNPGAAGHFFTRPNAADNYYGRIFWGTTGDVQVAGDYDGDNISDAAVFRPSTGEWWVRRSSDSTFFVQSWGVSTDIPVPGDYDGDEKIDLAVYRPNDPLNLNRGTWYILLSNRGFLAFTTTSWGQAGDVRVPADYDGDGKTDIAVFRPSDGSWWILRSGEPAATQSLVAQFGLNGDIAQPADYDGDGRADIAIFRPSTGTWWMDRSTSGITSQVHGTSTDQAATSANGVPR